MRKCTKWNRVINNKSFGPLLVFTGSSSSELFIFVLINSDFVLFRGRCYKNSFWIFKFFHLWLHHPGWFIHHKSILLLKTEFIAREKRKKKFSLLFQKWEEIYVISWKFLNKIYIELYKEIIIFIYKRNAIQTKGISNIKL